MKLRGITLAVLAVGMCGAKRKPPVTWWEAGSPSTMHPLWAASTLDLRAQAPIYDPLVERSGDAWTSPIAEITGFEDGRVTLQLRRDIKWHDGERLTSEDVCATVDAVRSRTAITPLGARIGTKIQHCAAADDWTAVIRLSETALPEPLSFLQFPVLPAHLGELTEPDHPISTAPVGTGPWKAHEAKGGWIYTPVNANHHASGRPELRLVPVAEGADLEGVDGWPRLPSDQVGDLRGREGWKLVPYPLDVVVTVALDASEPPLSDPGLREALDAALDRPALCETLVGSWPDAQAPPCRPTVSPFAARTKATNHGVPLPEHSPLGGDGGPLTVAIQAELEVDPDALCEQLTSMWAPWSVSCEVVPLGELVRIDALDRRKRWDAVVSQRLPATVDLAPELSMQGRLNWFSIADDQVLEDLAREGVEGKRLLHATLADQRPLLPLFELSAMSAWRTGFDPIWMTPTNGLGSMARWGFPDR